MKNMLTKVCWLLLLLGGSVGHTAIVCRELRSFGFLDSMGAFPAAALVQGCDGALYGTATGNGSDLGAVFGMNLDGTAYRALHHFGSVTNDGYFPERPVLEGHDGMLYGVTPSGGEGGGGIVFGINPNGSGYRILHVFRVYETGTCPKGELIEGSDGALYGTTSDGAVDYSGGTVFRLNKDGTGYTTLHVFSNAALDGQWPYAGLVEGTDGALYGTAERGGEHGGGTLFKMNRDGSDFAILHHFSGWGDAAYPHGTLLEASDGSLYGTSRIGGTTNTGTVFKIGRDGSNYRVLHSFDAYGPSESYPEWKLVEGADGALYGTLPNGTGTIFKVTKDGGDYRNLRLFGNSGTEPSYPAGGLVLAGNGLLYGTTVQGGNDGAGTVYRLNEQGAAFEVIYHFNITGGDGMNPIFEMNEARNGRLYGVTAAGGAGSWGSGFGMIYSCKKDGSDYQVVHLFSREDQHGARPAGGLVCDEDGTLYGTTAWGGKFDDGLVFRMDPDGGDYTVMHYFNPAAGEGSEPGRSLLVGSDGDLYGVSRSGGSNYVGTVFKLRRDGQGFRTLHHFVMEGDGAAPGAGLMEGEDGMLYGTTINGGLGYGTVYKLNKDGGEYAVLHNFSNDHVDGIRPQSRLVQTRDGMLYGTTVEGGADLGDGTIFRLRTNGTDYAVLKTVGFWTGQPQFIGAGLTQGVDGKLYGTTVYGGNSPLSTGGGTVFSISQDGAEFSVVYSFGNTPDGGLCPVAELFCSSEGELLGTTRDGGEARIGRLFSISGIQPRLEIVWGRAAPEATVLWPVKTLGYSLQTNAEPASVGWFTYKGPISTNRNTRSISATIGTTSCYWRLQK